VQEHVGARDQPVQHGAAVGELEVEHDAAFVAVAAQEHRPHGR
jgi:hypothetical protein